MIKTFIVDHMAILRQQDKNPLMAKFNGQCTDSTVWMVSPLCWPPAAKERATNCSSNGFYLIIIVAVSISKSLLWFGREPSTRACHKTKKQELPDFLMLFAEARWGYFSDDLHRWCWCDDHTIVNRWSVDRLLQLKHHPRNNQTHDCDMPVLGPTMSTSELEDTSSYW